MKISKPENKVPKPENKVPKSENKMPKPENKVLHDIPEVCYIRYYKVQNRNQVSIRHAFFFIKNLNLSNVCPVIPTWCSGERKDIC